MPNPKAQILLGLLEDMLKADYLLVQAAAGTTTTLTTNELNLKQSMLGWRTHPLSETIVVGTNVAGYVAAPVDIKITSTNMQAATPPSSTVELAVYYQLYTAASNTYGARTALFSVNPTMSAGADTGGRNSVLVRRTFPKDTRFSLDVVQAGGAAGVTFAMGYEPVETLL